MIDLLLPATPLRPRLLTGRRLVPRPAPAAALAAGLRSGLRTRRPLLRRRRHDNLLWLKSRRPWQAPRRPRPADSLSRVSKTVRGSRQARASSVGHPGRKLPERATECPAACGFASQPGHNRTRTVPNPRLKGSGMPTRLCCSPHVT
ncbi:MAG: hypothetical protein AVDCRST_MAG64-4127 [uncultured Phycisphaerae bacterium]|uniref:Uncharacterized protein n=1 Tax=uncultured Phycisphaerae bacterium TaxID=904963 RepID=A0A6J4QE99_9BACT|nr:MAG: hypothetical protein AVDCRST_MAG64-4127 [uncultured Phycisphaerae bacterium]